MESASDTVAGRLKRGGMRRSVKRGAHPILTLRCWWLTVAAQAASAMGGGFTRASNNCSSLPSEPSEPATCGLQSVA